MSFNLYFFDDLKRLNLRDFIEYFSTHNLYQINEGVIGSDYPPTCRIDTLPNGAFYFNEATGVYFYFQYHEGQDGGSSADLTVNVSKTKDDEVEPELEISLYENYSVSFSINLLRPRFFALEAELELSHFIETFSLRVVDPQLDGFQVYSRDNFIDSWINSNACGYKNFLLGAQHNTMPIHFQFAPAALLQRFWHWNYCKDILFNQFNEQGHDIYIPKIIFADVDGKVKTVVTWTAYVPIAIPLFVDIVVLNHDEYFAALSTGKTPQHERGEIQRMCAKTLSDMQPMLNHYEKVVDYDGSHFGGYYLVNFEVGPPPQEIVSLFDDCQLNYDPPFSSLYATDILDDDISG